MFLKNSLFLSLALFLFVGSCKHRVETHSFTFSGLGTVLTVIYADKESSTIEQNVKKQVQLFEKQVSYYNKDSFVSQFNRLKKSDTLSVPHWFCELVDLSLTLGEKTGNTFDITYKAKGKLWDKKGNTVPTKRQLQKLSSLVGPDLIVADCLHDTLQKKRDEVVVDLGGVAKGYLIDRVGDRLKEHKIHNFIVNFGGDMLVCGKKGAKSWKVGIKNPLKREEFLKVLSLSEKRCKAVATSGDYERFFKKNGKKYSHIIDPSTGRPIESVKSVTVVGESAAVVDLLATAISVGLKKEEFIKKIVASFDVAVYTLAGAPVRWKVFEPETKGHDRR